MWSVAVYDFGITTEQFWRLTFRQFHALSKRKDAERGIWDYSFGIVASVIANVNRDIKKKKEPYEAKDFVPDRLGRKRKVRKTAAALHDYWKANVMPAFNAKKNKVQ